MYDKDELNCVCYTKRGRSPPPHVDACSLHIGDCTRDRTNTPAAALVAVNLCAIRVARVGGCVIIIIFTIIIDKFRVVERNSINMSKFEKLAEDVQEIHQMRSLCYCVSRKLWDQSYAHFVFFKKKLYILIIQELNFYSKCNSFNLLVNK